MLVVRSCFLALALALFAAVARAQAPAGTLPTVIATPPTAAVLPGESAAALDLSTIFGLPSVVGPLVQLQTILGNITVELYPQTAPVTVANFLSYVNGGLYDNLFVNRSVPGFVIQTGGFTATASSGVVAVPVLGTIVNETKLSNVRGTLAMARTSDPNSASNQWFINLADNGGAPNYLDTSTGGYAVFARVIGTGMTVADAIAALPTYALDTGNFANTPLYNLSPTATSYAFSNFVRIPTVGTIGIYPDGSGNASVLGFGAVSSNNAVVTAYVSGRTLYLTGIAAGTATITVTATDSNGNQTATGVPVVVSGFAQQPVSQTVATGSTVVFSVGLTSVPAGTTYQWVFNSAPVAGATAARLVIANAASVGSYTCAVSSGGMTIVSSAATLALSTASNVGHLINLSVLTSDITASQNLTLGFVIGGSASNDTLLLRASGPALATFGLSGLLPDPLLALFSQSNAAVALATNAGWSSSSANQTAVTNADAATGAFTLTPGSLDSAMVQVLAPNNYSIVITGNSHDGGTTLGEVFDDTASGAFVAGTTHLKNLSSLVTLQPGDTLTGGFTIGGNTSKTVLIRAVGPGLAGFGLPSVMPDPQLKLFAGNTVLASNAGWGNDAQIVTTAATVSAFPLTAGSADSVLLVTLPTGTYSAQVNSVSGAGGAALVEVYEVP